MIVSHTEHYRRNGETVGLASTVREIDHLASLFEQVVHVAPLHPGRPPADVQPYAAPVRHVPVPPAGGERLRDKWSVLRAAPSYARAIRHELSRCDAVHVRCPANISLIALLLLAGSSRPAKRWVKYAGDWNRRHGAWSYRFQRALLRKKLHGAVVTVNGLWPGQPSHVVSFVNPCLTDAELREGERAASGKSLASPVRLLFVGRVEHAKGAGRVLRILRSLKNRGVPARLRVAGDGPERPGLEGEAARLGLGADVEFLGALPRANLSGVYADSDILLLPSSSEGWPKVLSEGMAFGAVPIASDVGSIPEYLTRFETGRFFPAEDVEAFSAAVVSYAEDPERWKTESHRAVQAASRFTYTHYLAEVRQLLNIPN